MRKAKLIADEAQTSLKRRFWFLLVVFSVTAAGFVGVSKTGVTATSEELRLSRPLSSAQQKSGQEIKVAEQVYKNIQVFKGLPASELEPTMAFISGSLGVKCNYCHTNPFEKDDKPTKQTARQMIKMVFDLNKGSFNGEKAVSCYTCHRGKPQPVSIPAVGHNLWQPNPTSAKESPLPTVDQILDRYVQAVGGEQAFRRVTSRVAKGSRIGADGILVPEDVYQKAPNKILTVTTYPDVAFSTGFNGIAGWGSSSKGGARELPGPVLAQLKSDSEFYKEIRTKELYRKLTLAGKSTIGEAAVYVIDATPLSGSPEKLFFDARTGLLVRRYMESETVLGMFPLQTDYEDYRDVDGIKQPFLIRWSMPGRSWGRKISEIKQNVTVDDAQFNPPSSRL
ncbi:MAG TPA: c-type cytochrome [Pyrinomonadaceae bacterium]|nr:c-type cytochrome [Pyrinomonadaceae bacterium]